MKIRGLYVTRLIAVILLAAFGAVIFRLYMLGGVDVIIGEGLYNGEAFGQVIGKIMSKIFLSWEVYVFAALSGAAGWALSVNRGLPGLIYKYRYPAALILLGVCVLLGLSGSSIGMWCELTGTKDSGLILGASRLIRSDEWAVGTPAVLSQAYNGGNSYSYFSSTIRGSATDYYLGFRQPVYDIAMIFKPFFWGYLFLPVEKGMAFYWFGRLISLALVSFEFGMLISKGKKGLSAVFMLLVTFSPAVQWWFSAALSDLLIYSMLSIVLFDRYAKEKSWIVRILYTAGIMMCAGCFIMVLYPSWQVPLVYVLIGLVIYVILENKGNFLFGIKDIAVIAAGLAAVCAVLAYIFNKSHETVRIISETVYPGERFETGGGFFKCMTEYFNNIWMTVTGYIPGAMANSSENAQFTDFFPVCYVPALIVLIRDKIRDRLIIVMLALTSFLGLWCVAGFPDFLAKVTFMYNSQASRTVVIFGFCNIILLIRGMSLMTKSPGRTVKIAVPAAGALVCAVTNYFVNRDYYVSHAVIKFIPFAASFAIFATAFYLMLCGNSKNSRMLFGALIALIVFMGGVTVNPLRKGVDAVENIEWVREIKGFGEKNAGDSSYESSMWLIDSEKLPFNNLLLLCGRTSFNATAVYPDLEKMALIDPDGRYADVYNRYAHITTVIKKQGGAYFEIGSAQDAITVYLTLDDAKKLGVKYITSRRSLDGTQTDNTRLVRMNDSDKYYIYKVQ